ncbi:MAG TPA: HAD-IA family hydrolase [Burkholderiales bacterium]|jgi:phosphoglycolate phosphatase
MKYPLIVFDWDGTILDSPSAIAQCIRRAAQDMRLPVPDFERASHVIGLGLADALRTAVPELPATRYPEFVEVYRRHFRASEESMQLFAGMRELIVELAARHTLAIATGKSRRGLERALEATALRPHFRASRCADETIPKPDPSMLHELMDELGVPPEGTLMIGDTSHDMEMARAAHVDALAVTYGAHPEAGLRACRPLDCCADVVRLRAWLTANA